MKKNCYLFHCLATMLLVLMMPLMVLAQERTVSGEVVDENGQPLPGVSIQLKNTQYGTITDFDGKYTLNLPSDGVLVFSYVGYLPKEVQIGTQTNINMQMEVDAEQLEEVVVIGYGTAKKEDLTGAVQSVSTDEFNKGAVASPQELVNGKIPGVQITTAGGAPGSGAIIRIRGGSSLTATNDPLIIIDGVPIDNDNVAGMRNPLNTINPNDIETFTVLKDASSTAIYGSRASNGVIIITTKKGRGDKITVDYSGNVSLAVPTKDIDVLNGTEYRALINEQFANDPNIIGLMGDADTDWQDEIFKKAWATEHNVAVSGSINQGVLPYRVSIGYNNADGTLRPTNLERWTGNINLNPQLFDSHLKINLSIKGMYIKNRFADQASIGNAINMDPTQPVRDEDGELFFWADAAGNPNPIAPFNPVAYRTFKDDRSEVWRSLGNIQLDYRFHFLPALRANLNLGYDWSDSDGEVDNLPGASYDAAAYETGSFQDYSQYKRNKLLEFYLAYEKEFPDIESNLSVLAGYSWQEFDVSDRSMEVFGDSVLNDQGVLEPRVRSPLAIDKTKYRLVSFFGRLNYTWKSKYLLTFTLRNDGSSRFGDDERWGLFPSLALAWNISNEPFLNDSEKVSTLKLRAGYGVTGQQDIGQDFGYRSVYTRSQPTANYVLYNNDGTFEKVQFATLRPEEFDPNLKWEETTTWNVGIDYGFFNDRVNGLLDFYYRKTDDLLNQIPVASGSNLSNELITNVGSLENKGIEFALNYNAIQNEDWFWEIGVNFTYNKNEITKLTNVDDPNYLGVLTGDIAGGTGNTIQIHSVGHPAFSFFVFEQVYDDDGKPVEGVYVDRNNDGAINDADKRQYKQPAPKALFGLTTRLTYRSWDFSATGRANFGNYVYNNVDSEGAYLNKLQTSGQYLRNVTSDIYDTRFQAPQYFSDYYVQDASFFRLDNISLGYSFDKIFGETSYARVYATVNNLFVITDYDGIDPEVNNIDEDGVSTIGIDNNFYPRPRTYLLGVNLSF
ncbi:TonB-dependent receptor [Limibacter armeniacum]|uniref:SusC/RagA family TonB-linked outer membrane protein n=1 Tax=Limibacter armeniacum TaxID=466084 RepID=UPI002FE62688